MPAVDLSELLLYINYFSLNGHGKCLWRNIRFGLLLSLLNFFYTLYSDILILSINFFFWTATSTTPRFVWTHYVLFISMRKNHIPCLLTLFLCSGRLRWHLNHANSLEQTSLLAITSGSLRGLIWWNTSINYFR